MDENSNGYGGDTPLAKLVQKAKGKRSYKAYAQDSGVSTTGVYRIIHGDFKPSVDTIRKLTSDTAKPEGGVTFDDMMVAAGYQSKKLDLYTEMLVDGVLIDSKEKQEPLDRKARMQLIRKYEAVVTGVLYRTLTRKGVSFEPITRNSDEHAGATMLWDFPIRVQMGEINEWFFEIKYYSGSFQIFFSRLLAYCVTLHPDAHRKISIVLNDPDAYERLKGYAGKLSYRGDLSIILFDEENLRFTEEKYIAHFDEEKQSEFYLI